MPSGAQLRAVRSTALLVEASRRLPEIRRIRRDPSPASPASTPGRLLVAVGDATPVEVVRRELDLHAVAGKDADVVAPHLAGDVPEDLVVVVELHAEHRVREGLGDLALHLNLVFLCQGAVKSTSSLGARRPVGTTGSGR